MEKEESSITEDEKILLNLRKCGHYLHHSNQPIQLNFLDDEEKKKIIAIFSMCLENWGIKHHS